MDFLVTGITVFAVQVPKLQIDPATSLALSLALLGACGLFLAALAIWQDRRKPVMLPYHSGRTNQRHPAVLRSPR